MRRERLSDLPPILANMPGYKDARERGKEVRKAYEELESGVKSWRGNDPVTMLYEKVFPCCSRSCETLRAARSIADAKDRREARREGWRRQDDQARRGRQEQRYLVTESRVRRGPCVGGGAGTSSIDYLTIRYFLAVLFRGAGAALGLASRECPAHGEVREHNDAVALQRTDGSISVAVCQCSRACSAFGTSVASQAIASFSVRSFLPFGGGIGSSKRRDQDTSSSLF